MASDIPERVRLEVLARDQYACVSCGTAGENRLQLHHVVYRSQGGTHDEENLATLCSDCHRLVHHGDLTVRYLEWRPHEWAWFCTRRRRKPLHHITPNEPLSS